MNDIDEKRLSGLLETRRSPSVPEGLNERIIAAAYRADKVTVQSRGVNFWDELSQLFLIPRPAYAFAVMVCLGITLGFLMDVSSSGADVLTFENLGTFMSVETAWSLEEGI